MGGWFGKLIGGTTGFFIGGPIGAVLGAVIGHSFDRRSNVETSGYSSYRSGSQTFTSNDQSQMIFFLATFSMLGKMAAADGKVSSEEIRAIEEFIDRNLRINASEKQFAMRIVSTSAQSHEPFEKFAQQFYSLFYRQPEMLQTMYDILYKVATADNSLTADEEKILDSTTKIFNLRTSSGSTAATYRASSSDKNYSTLECKKTDSNDTIKSAYKRLVKDYHPDTIASKGLPEEFTKFAAQKFTEINQAYEEIRKERNF